MTLAIYTILFGLLLTAVLGLFASWIDRKVTARVQYRVGPPLLQPAYDLAKLLGKETLIPTGAEPVTFLGAPLLGLLGVTLASALLWVNNLFPAEGFLGDWIVLLYLLLFPPAALILGAFSSGNPIAGQGGFREMYLLMGYELPFLLAALVPVIHSDFSLKLSEMIAQQQLTGIFALSWSGALGLLVCIIAVQAKLALIPFDIAEAETELAGGVLMEYSGLALAFLRLTRHMLMVTLPLLLITFFLGGLAGGLTGALRSGVAYVVLLALIIVIRNTNPRLRVDQVLRLLWGPVLAISVAGVLLALAGY